MSPEEALVLYGLARANVALACAAAGWWKHGADTPATRIQWRRVLGSLLPDTDAAHVTVGASRKEAALATSDAVSAEVDQVEAKRIAKYMKLRHLPEAEMMARWGAA
jgi:hypothetical protein